MIPTAPATAPLAYSLAQIPVGAAPAVEELVEEIGDAVVLWVLDVVADEASLVVDVPLLKIPVDDGDEVSRPVPCGIVADVAMTEVVLEGVSVRLLNSGNAAAEAHREAIAMIEIRIVIRFENECNSVGM